MPEAHAGLFAEDDDSTGGAGGGATGEKKFSQEDVDKAVSARLARESKAFEKKLADATKAATDKTAALEQQLADLTAKFDDAGKNDGQKELAKLQRELAKVQQSLADVTKERDEAVTGRDAAAAKHKDHVRDSKLTEALLAAKVLPNAAAKAVKLMASEAEVEIDDDGKVSVTLGGRVYDDVGKAASAFLDANTFLKAHPGGGAGTKNNGSGKGATAGDEMDERVLLESATREMVRGHVGKAALAGLDDLG